MALHFRAGDDRPRVARWENSSDAGEASAEGPVEALERAARDIEKSFEEKNPEAEAIREGQKKG